MVATELPEKGSRFHPPALIAQARSLYVVKGMSLNEVALKLGVPYGTVGTWGNRHDWELERKKRLERLSIQAEARAEDEDEAFLRSMASQSEELAESSMQSAREAALEGIRATRELQQASQSAKNFVDIYFKARKLDKASVDVNIKADLVFRLPTEEPKNVTPVETAPVTQALPDAQA